MSIIVLGWKTILKYVHNLWATYDLCKSYAIFFLVQTKLNISWIFAYRLSFFSSSFSFLQQPIFFLLNKHYFELDKSWVLLEQHVHSVTLSLVSEYFVYLVLQCQGQFLIHIWMCDSCTAIFFNCILFVCSSPLHLWFLTLFFISLSLQVSSSEEEEKRWKKSNAKTGEIFGPIVLETPVVASNANGISVVKYHDFMEYLELRYQTIWFRVLFVWVLYGWHLFWRKKSLPYLEVILWSCL